VTYSRGWRESEVRIGFGCALTQFLLIKNKSNYARKCASFFINILKVAMSAWHSVIIYQISAAFVIILLAETSLYYSAIFVGGDARFGFVFRCRIPSLRY